MRTIDRTSAHKSLTTKHETMRWISDYASVSVRKTGGRYCVRLENYETGQITKNSFATLPGALVNAEMLVGGYL